MECRWNGMINMMRIRIYNMIQAMLLSCIDEELMKNWWRREDYRWIIYCNSNEEEENGLELMKRTLEIELERGYRMRTVVLISFYNNEDEDVMKERRR